MQTCKRTNIIVFSIQCLSLQKAYSSFSLASCFLPLHPSSLFFHSSPYPSSFPTFYLLSSPFPSPFPTPLSPHQQNQRMITPRAASDTNSSPPPSGYIHFQNPLNCACVRVWVIHFSYNCKKRGLGNKTSLACGTS